MATELVQLGVDVLVVRPTTHALAAQQATSTVPIVFMEVGDPVARGLVASIARPGGNLTGLGSFSGVEMNAKRLELLRQAVPSVSRVAVLRYKNPALAELPHSSVEVLRAHMARTSFTSVGSLADSPEPPLRPSPAAGHAAEILDV